MSNIEKAHHLIDLINARGRLLITAAFWMDDIEFDRWTLNLVSPSIDQIGLRDAFGAIRETFEDHPELDLDMDLINPVSPSQAPTREVLEFIENYPTPKATRPYGIFLKGHFVERAYIYPIDLG